MKDFKQALCNIVLNLLPIIVMAATIVFIGWLTAVGNACSVFADKPCTSFKQELP